MFYEQLKKYIVQGKKKKKILQLLQKLYFKRDLNRTFK